MEDFSVLENMYLSIEVLKNKTWNSFKNVTIF